MSETRIVPTNHNNESCPTVSSGRAMRIGWPCQLADTQKHVRFAHVLLCRDRVFGCRSIYETCSGRFKNGKDRRIDVAGLCALIVAIDAVIAPYTLVGATCPHVRLQAAKVVLVAVED